MYIMVLKLQTITTDTTKTNLVKLLFSLKRSDDVPHIDATVKLYIKSISLFLSDSHSGDPINIFCFA